MSWPSHRDSIGNLARAGILILSLCGGVRAADWPQYRSDANRAGYSEEALGDLTLCWTYHARHAPQPAWPNDDRLIDDYVFQPVMAGERVFFGSSTDGKLYALDAASGKELWSAHTEGPIRYAPCVWQDRVVVGSDDGYLYAFSAADGRSLWKFRAGPRDERVLGNGRMISRWPIRGGPVVLDDNLYFGAGVWPSDGIYLYCVRASDGTVLWKNENADEIAIIHPHETKKVPAGIAPQGYLASSKSDLWVPTGRNAPASFARADGTFKFVKNEAKKGGSSVWLADDWVFNNQSVYAWSSKGALDFVGSGAADSAAAAPHGLYLIQSGSRLVALDRTQPWATSAKGTWNPKVQWQVALPVEKAPATVLIVAGAKIFVAVGEALLGIDSKTHQICWKTDLGGVARGLAVANGRLLASTESGRILCFASSSQPATTVKSPDAVAVSANPTVSEAAAAILKMTGVQQGYALDWGCGDGALSAELLMRSQLNLYAVEPDAELAAQARRRFESMGLYGKRIWVWHGDLAHCPYPDYFADLIVSGRSVSGSKGPGGDDELKRLLRPSGGQQCLGPAGALAVIRRGRLEGTGEWTHLYADAGNTCSSEDQVIKAPFDILWYGDLELDIPNRHGRPPPPLFLDGRMLVPGTNGITAVNAYNGQVLWKYEMKGLGVPFTTEQLLGVSGTGGVCCAGDGSLFVRMESQCVRIEASTGKKQHEFAIPSIPGVTAGRWGYVAFADGLLFGSVINEDWVVNSPYAGFTLKKMKDLKTESRVFFCLDAASGELKWTYAAKHSLRHHAIAIGKGRVFLLDRPLADSDKPPLGAGNSKPTDSGDGDPDAVPQQPSKSKPEHPSGQLVCLDSRTGEVVWREAEIKATTLGFSAVHDVVLASYLGGRFGLYSDHGSGLTALRASDGKVLWKNAAACASKPALIGRTVYAEPSAWDLLTGAPKLVTPAGIPWRFARTHYCGLVTASTSLLLFRSGCMGYVDLLQQPRLQLFSGIRPGCWINIIPAGGLVLAPDGTTNCTCSYMLKTTVALAPRRARPESK